jgi:hypothetical protein
MIHFTKKEALKTGVALGAENVLKCVALPEEVMANLSRLKWVVDSAENHDQVVEIYDKRTVLGLEFNHVQGVNTPNYADDEIQRT